MKVQKKSYPTILALLVFSLVLITFASCEFTGYGLPTVTVTPSDARFGMTSGGGEFVKNATITISATPYPGYQFVSWNDGNTDATRTIKVQDDSVAYTAIFRPIVYGNIELLVDDSHHGLASGGGSYPVGTQTNLIATAYEGYHFTRWSDDNANANRTVVVEPGTKRLTASFARNTTSVVTLNTSTPQYGMLSGGGVHTIGSTATIRATANPGYHFVSWNDGNTSASRTIQVGETDCSYLATFEANPCTAITIESNSTGGGVTSGSGSYPQGSTITINATANPGHRFVKWEDDSTSASRTIIVGTTEATYTAYFERNTLTAVTLLRNNDAYGTVSGSGVFAAGSSLSISATAQTGYRFVRWNDDSTQATRTITVPQTSTTYTAYFETVPITITAVPSDAGHGTVTGSGSYTYKSIQTLQATAASGYRFIRWSDNNTQARRTIIVPARNTTYTAYFERVATVSVVSNESSYGSVTGTGNYQVGATVVITATANTGYRFVRWSDEGTNPQRSITVPQAGAVYTATFERTGTVQTSINIPAAGHILGTGSYPIGSTITLSVVTNPGYRFLHWGDDSTAVTRTLTVTADGASLSAVYEALPIIITVASHNSEQGTVTGGGTYTIGTSVNLAATANAGYRFVRWNDSVTEAARTITVPLDGASYTAYFEPIAVISVVSENTSYGNVSGAGTYTVGATTTISAIPLEGHRFVRWTDGSTYDTRTITAYRDITYTAQFERNSYTLGLLSQSSSYGSATGSGTYPFGSEVSITATPLQNYRFLRWSDDNTNATRTFTIPAANSSLTAYFQRTTVITTRANDAAYGTTTGDGTYDANTSITITATAQSRHRFVRWDDNSTNATRTITVPTSARTYTAYFEKISTLSVVSANSSNGVVNGSGIYAVGASRTISATPNERYRFLRWNDGITSATRTIQIPETDATYTAYFEPISTITVTSNQSAYGSVSGSGIFTVDSSTPLAATANTGYRFVRWSDGNTNSERTISVPSEDTTYTAFFEPLSYQINVETENQVHGTVSGSGTFPYQSTTTISATANTGYEFSRWSDGNISASRTITIPLNGATYTATFRQVGTLITSVNNSAYGSVTGGGTYPVDQAVTLTAIPLAGYQFSHWFDNYTEPVRTITVQAGITPIMAYFERAPLVAISVASDNSTYGTVSGSGSYYVGTEATLIATPSAGYRFVRWNDYNTDATRTVTVPSSGASYTAYFDLAPPTIIFSEKADSNNWGNNTTSYAGTWNISTYNHYYWTRSSSTSYSSPYCLYSRKHYSYSEIAELKRTLNLSNFTSATLTFKESKSLGSSAYLSVRVTNQYGTTTTLATYSSSNSSWVSRTVDLSAYAGQTITLIFKHYAPISYTYSTVYLDDIQVTAR